MPPLAIAAAISSAIIHASWNAVLKGGTDRVTDSFLIAVGGLGAGALIILLMGALPAGVVVLDRDARVVQANKAVESMFGVVLAGIHWTDFCAGRLAETETPGEWQLDQGGETRRVTRVDAPLESGEGRIVLLTDVTDAHRMRLAAERNERLAAMGEMVAGLAHQLRTPLSAALLYTATLVQQDMGPADKERVGSRALERLRHLEKLIRDMLLFARGETLGREPFPICDLVVASLEDAVGQTHRPNLPGTVDEHPNWSLALPVLVEDLDSTDPRNWLRPGLPPRPERRPEL